MGVLPMEDWEQLAQQEKTRIAAQEALDQKERNDRQSEVEQRAEHLLSKTGDFQGELVLHSYGPLGTGGTYTFDLDLPAAEADADSRLVAALTQDCVEREARHLVPRQLIASNWTALTERPRQSSWFGRLFGA